MLNIYWWISTERFLIKILRQWIFSTICCRLFYLGVTLTDTKIWTKQKKQSPRSCTLLEWTHFCYMTDTSHLPPKRTLQLRNCPRTLTPVHPRSVLWAQRRPIRRSHLIFSLLTMSQTCKALSITKVESLEKSVWPFWTIVMMSIPHALPPGQNWMLCPSYYCTSKP